MHPRHHDAPRAPRLALAEPAARLAALTGVLDLVIRALLSMTLFLEKPMPARALAPPHPAVRRRR